MVPSVKSIEGQLSTGLPETFSHITTHDPKTKQAVFHSSRPASWKVYDGDQMAFNVVYTTSTFPVDMNDDADVKTHDKLIAEYKLGLINPGGTVLRMVDFAPGYECILHRTESLDYGIVLEGCLDAILDSGERKTIRRGDVVVQRGTLHAWKNNSETEWARMIYVLQESKEIRVGGEVLGENLGRGVEGLPSSR
jgi:quercetin dioxygenase-like cupin family protein